MPAGTLFWSIESAGIGNQLFHSVTVRCQDLGDVGLWPRRFREPPDSVHRILRPQFALVHPFDRTGKL